MIQKSSRKEVVEFIDDITCDKCGESLKITECESPLLEQFYGLTNCTVSGGYSSPALNDGQTYIFDMCEKCLVELFKTFKRQPRETHYL